MRLQHATMTAPGTEAAPLPAPAVRSGAALRLAASMRGEPRNPYREVRAWAFVTFPPACRLCVTACDVLR